ncbi:efflux RND transporter periplasmic adaptor subunit [Longibacter salinarum]|nr:efflux RND transporter periplasmic adaptor subunit [Longibacter salinarum]
MSESPTSSTDASSDDRIGTSRLVVIGAVAILLVGLAIPRLFASSSEGNGNQGGGSGAPLGVDIFVAQPTRVTETLQTSATLRANESVELTSEASGKVTSIRFEEGSRVRAGQLLLTINDAELQAERKRLEYRLQLAEDREERQQSLLDRGGVSQEEYDAVANEVSVLRAELDLVEARIEKTEIRAPFAGTIGLRNVSEGSYISPQTTISTLQALNPMKVDLAVPEQYAGRIQPGQTISFRTRGTDRAFEGDVYAVEPRIEPSTRTLRLRARADNGDGALRPGAYADATIRLGTVPDALMVPAMAVLPTLGGQRLFVKENGTAQPRNVSLGVRTDSTVQVINGLAPGDSVITSGIQNLRAGLPVTPDK